MNDVIDMDGSRSDMGWIEEEVATLESQKTAKIEELKKRTAFYETQSLLNQYVRGSTPTNGKEHKEVTNYQSPYQSTPTPLVRSLFN
jgi:hypothetical protein